MKKSNLWVWKAYFAIYLYLTLADLYTFFSPDSQMYWYYHILIAYSDRFIVPFLLNAASLILNTLAILALYLFISRKAWLSPRFWGGLFFLRVFLDIFGKSFEGKILRAIFFDDPYTGWLALGMLISLTLPSYIALYLYAFRRERLLRG